LCLGGRMNAVCLQQIVVQGDALHEELDPGNVKILCYVAKYALESTRISGTVVARDANAEQYDGSARLRSRFARIRAGGKPRRPSLPPSSRMTSSGENVSSAASIRAAPPSVVSPLMLAFTTRCSYPCSSSRSCNKAAQDWSTSIPYPALSESPNISTVGHSDP